MRQVCTEASNESFAGNSGFYEEKKDEEGDKKEGDQLRAPPPPFSYGSSYENKVRELQLSYRRLRGSLSVLPQCEDKRLECIKLAGSPNPTSSTAAAAVCEPQ